MEKNNQKVDINDLLISAGNLESALEGLGSFADEILFSSKNITTKDIGALNGLIKAVHCLAKEHCTNTELFEGGLNHE